MDRIWDADSDSDYESTSYTLSWDAGPGGISDGADNIRGSLDDFHDGIGGSIAESVSWFRRSDNNPVVVDATAIDSTTFSRSITTGLPSGSTWGANANRAVAASLGHATTQSALYSALFRGVLFNGITADDANQVHMARTGVDRLSGTADDYTVALSIVPCLDPHEIRVRFVALGTDGPLGLCYTAREFSYTQNPMLARDYELVHFPGFSELEIQINSDYDYDPSIPIFADGFESTNFAAWSSTN